MHAKKNSSEYQALLAQHLVRKSRIVSSALSVQSAIYLFYCSLAKNDNMNAKSKETKNRLERLHRDLNKAPKSKYYLRHFLIHQR